MTLEQLAEKIRLSLPEISKAVADAEFVGINDVFSNVHRRIFIQGRKTDGSLIGVYTDKYKKVRQKFGRSNISFVDLNLTDQLMNSINVGESNGKPTFGFLISTRKEGNLTNPELADNLEERFGVIFAPSEQERAEAITAAQEFLKNKLTEIVRKWS